MLLLQFYLNLMNASLDCKIYGYLQKLKKNSALSAEFSSHDSFSYCNILHRNQGCTGFSTYKFCRNRNTSFLISSLSNQNTHHCHGHKRNILFHCSHF